MSFFTSDQHWNNLVEENKKTPFIEESDFALINIIPGKFPQYGGDCPRLLRQVAYVNIPNIIKEEKKKNEEMVENGFFDSSFENDFLDLRNLKEQLFISILRLEILEARLYSKNPQYYNKILKSGKTNLQSSLSAFQFNNSFKINSKEVLKDKCLIKNNERFSFKRLFKSCM
uniref:Uncharacterized protein n=1 Tax=Strongyloides papillosus TaxID=174720 RepID=A0A0N5BAL5_STREA